jgi:hypothetical protein
MWCLQTQSDSDSLKNAEVCTFYSDDSECHNDSDEMICFLSWIDPKQILGTMQPYCFLKINSVVPPPTEQAAEGVRSHFDAKALYQAMKKVLSDDKIEQKLIKFICFDGTNVMSGDKGGVQTLWRKDHPSVIYINCRNHRLALVFVHLKKRFHQISEFYQLLLNLVI